MCIYGVLVVISSHYDYTHVMMYSDHTEYQQASVISMGLARCLFIANRCARLCQIVAHCDLYKEKQRTPLEQTARQIIELSFFDISCLTVIAQKRPSFR